VLVQAGAAGYTADSVLVLTGVLRFPPHAVLGWPSTVWMVALWVLQAAVLGGALSWMQRRFILAAIVGVIGGPLAYLAGERMARPCLGRRKPWRWRPLRPSGRWRCRCWCGWINARGSRREAECPVSRAKPTGGEA